MMQIRVSKWCLHHFMISAMLSFKITGAVFGMTLRTWLSFYLMSHDKFVLYHRPKSSESSKYMILQGWPWYVGLFFHRCTPQLFDCLEFGVSNSFIKYLQLLHVWLWLYLVIVSCNHRIIFPLLSSFWQIFGN